MTDLNLDELRKIAQEASPDPFNQTLRPDYTKPPTPWSDVRFIATFNPKLVLELLRRVEQLESIGIDCRTVTQKNKTPVIGSLRGLLSRNLNVVALNQVPVNFVYFFL